MSLLYRAIAYRLQRLDTTASEYQPEVTVFFECTAEQAADSSIVSARLLRLLAFAWNCPAPEVEFYNLTPEAELLAGNGLGDLHLLGDAALLVSGWYNGPLFCSPERTLALVGPATLRRLAAARTAASRVQERRLAIDLLTTPRGAAARAEYEAVQAMGGAC